MDKLQIVRRYYYYWLLAHYYKFIFSIFKT